MNDQFFWDENRDVWDAVVQSYRDRHDSILEDYRRETHEPESRTSPSSYLEARSPDPAPKLQVGSADAPLHTPRSVQKDLLDILKKSTLHSLPQYSIPRQLEHLLLKAESPTTSVASWGDDGWSLQCITSEKTLLIREDLLRESCDSAVTTGLGHLLAPVAVLVVMPSVGQATEPLSHPTVVSLCAVATEDPEVFTRACFAPALVYSASPHCPELLAKVIRQMHASILPSVHLLMRALVERETIFEQHLALLDAVCAILPSDPHRDLIQSVSAALQYVSSSLPSTSIRVGRTMLTVVPKLAPHITQGDAIFQTTSQAVGAHTSPLQRAIQAQLEKIP